MKARLGIYGFLGVLALTGCDREADVETADSVVQDTAMLSAGRGGMGAMGGMGPGAMSAEWQQHMAAMRAAAGDSLQAMMPRHRQLATRMMENMNGQARMGMDSTWMATRDSLRLDLDRMQNMTPEEAEAFLEEHDARMQRMLRMHQPATGGAPPQ